MHIHAIQTGTVTIRPNQRQGKGTGFLRLVNTLSDRRWTEPLPIFVWVIEHPEGVIVIDTGETAQAAMPGHFPSWHPYFRHVIVNVRAEQEIGPQLQTMGIPPDEVRWVILTHLHTDHAGGLHHFPKSEVLVMRRAYQQASGFMGKMRGFLPHRWPSSFAPRLIGLPAEPFGVFPESFKVTQAGDVAIVPTPGHTEDHVSVILQTAELSVFFAGDASYTQQLMIDQQIDGVAADANQARQTLRRIRQFARSTPTVYLPTHDLESDERLAKRSVVTFENMPGG